MQDKTNMYFDHESLEWHELLFCQQISHEFRRVYAHAALVLGLPGWMLLISRKDAKDAKFFI